MSFPQLRIRSEFSFRKAYGSVERVAEVLQELQTPSAGLVDTSGTWGHVTWEKALTAANISPLYGTEFAITSEDSPLEPRWWCLATDIHAFYRLSSTNPTDAVGFAEYPGVVKFTGGCLDHIEYFDYVDINPQSRRHNLMAIRLAQKYGKPIVITSDNDYPAPADYDCFMAWCDARKMTPQHLLSESELLQSLNYIPSDILKQAVRNTHEVAERCSGIKLPHAPMIHVDGDLGSLVEQGRQYRLERGHIKEWTREYEARLKKELGLIAEKDYESYFLVVADLMIWSKQHMLCGPARGSSAGSLVCYLLQITEVDPIPFNLIFERFIDVNRSDLPDIDVDLADSKRHMAFEYLAERYGSNQTARIGSINRLKPRSAVAHAGKNLGIPHGAAFPTLNVLFDYSSGDSRYGKALEDTLNGTRPGKDFKAQYPECSYMAAIENTASHTGQHAAGQIVANVPVVEYCTVRDGIAHIDKHDAEYLNLLKIDILGLRTLGIIEDTESVTAQELYDLKLDDPKVFEILNDHKFSGVFQFEGAGQRRVSEQIHIDSFERMDHITALARPGPLASGGTNHYINRLKGVEQVEYPHPTMEPYLNDTLGIVCYQEQAMRISREMGRLSWEDVTHIRKAMSASKGEEFFNKPGRKFVRGAVAQGIPKDEAQDVWNSIVTFGSWAMNKSHTVSYSIISYWTAWLKAYHPLAFAAASLRHAKDDEQTTEILRELRDEGVSYIPFDAQLSGREWAAVDGQLLGGYQNLVGIGPVKAAFYVNKRESQGLDDKDLEKLSKHKVKHEDLRPAHTRWGDIYHNPSKYLSHGRVHEFGDLADRQNACVICRLIRLERRDENETVRVARRGGNEWRGDSLFLDTFVVDDSVSSPIRARIGIRNWKTIGERMADEAVPGDWFMIRGRYLAQFAMMNVYQIRCLNKPEMFR